MLAQLKKHLTPHELWEDAKFFFLLNLGLVATAVGIAVFKTPNHFAFGGTSGLSIVLATLFPRWNVGAFMWFINAALVVLGFVFLGIRSMGWTIYSSFALSFYVSLCERVCPLSAPLTSDAFLELCFAVILSAVGAAVVFNIGASTGGTDIVAMILNKYTSMPVGRALMVSDLGIVLVGAYLYGPATGLYCILGMILKSTVADSAIESINLRKVCTVVTSNPQPVRDFIVNDLHRSATMEQAEGAYTHDEKWVLTTGPDPRSGPEAPPARPRSGRPRLYHDCEQQRDRGQGLPGDLKNQSLPPRGKVAPQGRMRAESPTAAS